MMKPRGESYRQRSSWCKNTGGINAGGGNCQIVLLAFSHEHSFPVHMGNSRKAIQHYRHTKELFDQFRDKYFLPDNCANLKWIEIISEKFGKVMINPYLDKEVKEYFYQFDWTELNQRPEKHFVRGAFEQFAGLKVNRHLNLQVNSSITGLFEELLENQEINFRNRSRVMDVCRDWYNLS